MGSTWFRSLALALIAGSLWASPAPAAEPMAALAPATPFRYPETTEGKGSLKYISGLPVLTLSGTPEEIGKQTVTLGTIPGRKLAQYPREFVQWLGLELTWPTLTAVGGTMVKNFPEHQRQEFETIVKEAKGAVGRTELVAANTMFDIKKFFFCSTILIDPAKSGTGGPLLGRNLDFPTLGYLQDYTAVMVYKQPGKRAFASVGFPGVVGVLSGMNDAGLAVAVLEVYSSKDGSPKFDIEGIPYAMSFRRVLEECATVAEAEKLLRSMKRTTYINLAVADKTGGAVFEITPKRVEVRKSQHGICPCTNHFRTDALSMGKECWRYEELSELATAGGVSVRELAGKLHAVNQDKNTMQSMIFEPATLKLHLAFGKLPATKAPMKTLDLAPLFGE